MGKSMRITEAVQIVQFEFPPYAYGATGKPVRLVAQTFDGSMILMERGTSRTFGVLDHQGIEDLIIYLTYWKSVLVEKGVWNADQ